MDGYGAIGGSSNELTYLFVATVAGNKDARDISVAIFTIDVTALEHADLINEDIRSWNATDCDK
jgi:hypothetical protein